MNAQTQPQLQLESLAKWAQACDPALALQRWQMLADRLQPQRRAA